MSSLGLIPLILKRDRKKQGVTKISPLITIIGLLVVFGFAVSLVLLLNKSVSHTQENIQNDTIYQSDISGVTVESSFFDESCEVKIGLSNGKEVRIPTDHQVHDPNLKRCYQVKYIHDSPNKKYVAFEGADWHSKNPADGNNLTVYFVDHNNYFIWPIGAAVIDNLQFDAENNLNFSAVYDQTDKNYYRIAIPFVDKNFSEAVDPTTHEIKLIEGVLL